jgi:AAA+ ATPase superfamily predicted ATPase
MYFSPEPKTKIEDFFDMEEELKLFRDGLSVGKFIVVTGLRRYGKTSLILTGLNSLSLDYIFLDCRLLPSGMISVNDFIDVLEDELNRKSWAKEVLQKVEGVGVGGLSLRFKERNQNTLLKTLEKLENKVLVLDEAQELRRANYRFDYFLAYIYDHVNMKVVISGSQVGLLYRFLRIEDPEAPLFGRPYIEVRLKRLNTQMAKQFLKRGFEQVRLEVSGNVIDEAVDAFDGIIGWLTYLGYSYIRSKEPTDRIIDKASKLSGSEVSHALNVYGVGKKRYVETLKIVASRNSSRWSEIKRALEAKLGKIPNNVLSNILRNLVDQGLLERTNGMYEIADPILRTGILRHL